MNQRKKIAILMTLAGGGHLSVAKSLQQILSSKFEVVIINFYEEIIKSDDEKVYNKILKYNLSFLYWIIFVRAFRLKLFFLKSRYASICRKYFDANKFDLVISVIPFFNEILSQAINTRFIILPTDLGNPYPKYWYANANLIITCTSQLFEQARKCGYSNIEKISSLPLREEFYLPQKLDMSNDKRIKILIMYGKTPPNRIIRVVNGLSVIKNLNITVICGENDYLFNKINMLPSITAYKLMDNICEIIDNNDIVITKPGPTTIFESISRGTYLLLEDGFRVMKQEKYNIEFVINNNYGESFVTIKELINILNNLNLKRHSSTKNSFLIVREQILQIVNKVLTTAGS